MANAMEQLNTYRTQKAVESKNNTKNDWLRSPMQLPINTQWWSKRFTQLLQLLQWLDIGGRIMQQVLQ